MIKRYNLLLKALKELDKHQLLNHLVLTGSWCLLLYSKHYKGIELSTIRTRDVDFLFPLPSKIRGKVDIPEILEEVGFSMDFSNSGIIRLTHPQLLIDFIVPDRGKGLPSPYKLPELGINAQPLRFQDILAKNTVSVNLEDMKIILPNPAAFALQKLLISSRRAYEEKGKSDKRQAIELLHELVRLKNTKEIKSIYNMLSKKSRKVILDELSFEPALARRLL